MSLSLYSRQWLFHSLLLLPQEIFVIDIQLQVQIIQLPPRAALQKNLFISLITRYLLILFGMDDTIIKKPNLVIARFSTSLYSSAKGEFANLMTCAAMETSNWSQK